MDGLPSGGPRQSPNHRSSLRTARPPQRERATRASRVLTAAADGRGRPAGGGDLPGRPPAPKRVSSVFASL